MEQKFFKKLTSNAIHTFYGASAKFYNSTRFNRADSIETQTTLRQGQKGIGRGTGGGRRLHSEQSSSDSHIQLISNQWICYRCQSENDECSSICIICEMSKQTSVGKEGSMNQQLKRTHSDLRQECQENKLCFSGNKRVLATRIVDSQKS